MNIKNQWMIFYMKKIYRYDKNKFSKNNLQKQKKLL